jgi:hypothetical protein
MTALILSFLLISYIVIPGILVRRIVSMFVPLRRPQWTRTEEITSAVVGSFVPFCVAAILVKTFYWFGHHPFPFDDSAALRWNDYKTVFSASYSEKLYEGFLQANNDAFWQTVLRVIKRQSRIATWFYAASAIQAVIIGAVTANFGRLRKNQTFDFIARKFIIPNISEWHVMLTPFTFHPSPKRSVRVEILTPDEKLYRGIVGDYHIDRDGHLTGVLLRNACRFDRKKHSEDRAAVKLGPSETYWKPISGHTLYIMAEKIHNLNISYPPDAPLQDIAETKLKELKLNVPGHLTVELSQGRVQPEKAVDHPSTEKNFTNCPHCAANKRPSRLVRVDDTTPVISRTDGHSYHIFLLYGPPNLPPRSEKPARATRLLHFRYALDKFNLTNDPVIVQMGEVSDEKKYLKALESIVDKFEEELRHGRKLVPFYSYEHGQLASIPVK